MNLLRLTLLCILSALPAANSLAAIRDEIYHPDFHSLKIYPYGNPYAPPIICLGSPDKIVIEFDELAEQHRYLRYQIKHCSADWRDEGLVASEFLTGFNEGDITDYSYSSATTVHYVHYRIVLPNDDISFTISGNYALNVYDENNPDTSLLQATFSVTEQSMKVSATVTSRTDFDYNGKSQQLSVVVDRDAEPVNNLFTDLIVNITQNGRKDNEIYVTQPLRVASGKAYFEHSDILTFKAGNEFRRMENVSMNYPGMGVEDIAYAYPYYHVTLCTDEPRNEQPYQYDSTQFGRYTIRTTEIDGDYDTYADYALVHFSLATPEQTDADIFLDGEFTQRKFSPESRMIYNRVTNNYEASILLKQGAYNYQYLTVPHGSQIGYTSPMEGDNYRTINEYTVKIFYREPGSRFDRLTAATTVYSGN